MYSYRYWSRCLLFRYSTKCERPFNWYNSSSRYSRVFTNVQRMISATTSTRILVPTIVVLAIFIFTVHRIESDNVHMNTANDHSKPVKHIKRKLIHVDTKFQYVPPLESNISSVGMPLDVDTTMMTSLGIPFTDFPIINPKAMGNFVFVTAASSNHFAESIDAVAGVQKHMPGYIIYYYDIGLDVDQIDQVRFFCNVVYRKFNFDKYPAHVKELVTYAFKPLIVQDMLLSHTAVLWIDASIRLRKNLTVLYSQIIDTGGFLNLQSTGFYNYAVTDKRLYTYLPTSVAKQMHTAQGEENCIYIQRTESVYKNIVYWWVLCALDRDCIAPKGATSACVPVNGNYTVYMGCHRFDQSVLGILASNFFGFKDNKFLSPARSVDIIRGVTNMFPIQLCSPAHSRIEHY